MMESNNPYKHLYKRLTTPFKDEETNCQSKFVRLRFLQVFMDVVESNPMMDFSALNIFTLQELNVCKILMRKTYKTEFLPYFTKGQFLRSKEPLKYFAYKIGDRGDKVRIVNKSFRNQFDKIRKGVLLKLECIQDMKRRYANYDPQFFTRIYLKNTGLGKYMKWCQKVGDKFSNRCEKDFSEFYCLSIVQGDRPTSEKQRL